MRKALFLLFVLTLAAGCGGKAHVVTYTKTMPEWVTKGQGAFPGEETKLFAVGMAQGMQNVSLRQQTADNRARAGIAQVLSSYVESMAKDFVSNTADGEGVLSEDQYVEQVQRTLVNVSLRGAMIMDRWESREGVLYSLAVLDLNSFADLAAKQDELSAPVREHIRDRSQEALRELDANLQRNR